MGYGYAWLWIKYCLPSGAGNVTSGIVGSEARRRMETWRWRYVGSAVPTFVLTEGKEIQEASLNIKTIAVPSLEFVITV